MKVVHVAQMLKGGVGDYFCEMLPEQIKELGEEQVVVIVAEKEAEFLPALLPSGSIRTFQSTSRAPTALLKTLLHIKHHIRAERPDILHLHSSFAGAIVRLSYLFWPFKRPRIV